MPAIPFIAPAIAGIGAIGSLMHHGQMQSGAATGTDELRAFVTKMLTGGSLPTGGPAGQLTVDPAASLAGTNGLFEATRASALGQAKESAGNLTGSGYNNLFGSALAQSLAQQQKQLADTTLDAGKANQQTWASLFNQFGNTGVGGGQQSYKPSFFEGLGGAAGPLGTLAGMFGGGYHPSGSEQLSNSSFAQAGPSMTTETGWQ